MFMVFNPMVANQNAQNQDQIKIKEFPTKITEFPKKNKRIFSHWDVE